MYSRSNSFSRNVNNGKESPTLTGRNIPVAGSLNHRRAQSLNGISSSNKSSSKCNSNGFDENSLDLFSLKNHRSSNAHNALPSSDDSSDASLKLGRLSLGSLKVSRNGLDDLLSTTDGGKHDYDWLLTPPETPLFPSSDGSERQPMSAAPRSASLARSTSTTKPSRLSVSQSENNHPSRPARSSSITRPSLSTSHYSTYSSSRSTSILNTSSASVSSYIRPSSPSSRSSSSARPSTPSARTSSRSSTPSRSRPSTTATSNEKPRSSSRPSTPSSRPHIPANLSSPAARSGSRSSTPTRRSSAPSLSMTLGSLTSNGRIPLNGRSSAPSSRASSPGPRPRTPQQPIIPPDFPLDTPPNLRTSLADRPLSAGRSRPNVSLTTKGNPEASGPASMPKRQSSPIGTRGRLTESPVRGRLTTNGHSLDKPEPRRATNVSELAGRKPVKSSTPVSDSMGFGRSISKRSLDMAIRHMDIKNGTGGNRLLSGTTTLFPQSVRSASTKNHSPRGTSTSASNNTNGYQPAGRNQYTFDGNHINRAPENGYSPDNAHYSAKLSEVDIYESTRYDAMFLKEDLKNTSWLHSVDDKADQGPIFDNGFESLPEPFELL